MTDEEKPLRWTTEPPTSPGGWYFVTDNVDWMGVYLVSFDPASSFAGPFIRTDTGGLTRQVPYDDRLGWRFAGPIAMPVEPTTPGKPGGAVAVASVYAFIAAAHTEVPRLLDENAKLRELLDKACRHANGREQISEEDWKAIYRALNEGV